MHVSETPPRTILEVYKCLPEGTRIQLIEDNLVMSPTSSDSHQKILGKLCLLIGNYVEDHVLGEVRVAPYDVYLDARNAFQPDMVFVARKNIHFIWQDGLHGAPDFVLEVLSPSNQEYDLTTKKVVYERNGVKEYWLVDPKTNETTGFSLSNGNFVPIPSSPGRIISKLFQQEFHF